MKLYTIHGHSSEKFIYGKKYLFITASSTYIQYFASMFYIKNAYTSHLGYHKLNITNKHTHTWKKLIVKIKLNKLKPTQ